LKTKNNSFFNFKHLKLKHIFPQALRDTKNTEIPPHYWKTLKTIKREEFYRTPLIFSAFDLDTQCSKKIYTFFQQ
jgi:hypothetical protein